MRIKINDKIYRLKEVESGVDSLRELVEEPKHKHGDFLMNDNRFAFILDREGGDGEAYYLFCTDMDGVIRSHMQDRKEGVRYCGYLKHAVLADSEATEAIHYGLKSIGKRWNADKKCIEDIPKRKFKAGDKVKIKDGISSDTHRYVSPNFTEPMDEFIGKELTVKEYSNDGFVVFNGDYLKFHFHENWLEPWIDEPKVGDWVVAWDVNRKAANVGILEAVGGGVFKYVVDGLQCMIAVKWDGTKEHLEKIRKG